MHIGSRFRTRDSGPGTRGSSKWWPWRRLCAVVVLLICAIPSPAAEVPRTITLAPHLTELAFAAGGGDALVGVVDWSDYPPEATELPVIGDAFRFDLETIIGLDPDLALAWRGGTPAQATERLESLDIEVVWIETCSLDDIARALKRIGKLLGTPESGEVAAQEFRDRLDSTGSPAQSVEAPVEIFYQASARPLYTLGGRHVINEVFEHCGARNVFADLDIEASVVDHEAVIARAPDLIIVGKEEGNDDPMERWRNSSLVTDGPTSLHAVDPSLLVRPTPRILEGIRHVCHLVTQHTNH